jgi:ABC-type branched-subunit amino acid transport system substrate-binding protein
MEAVSYDAALVLSHAMEKAGSSFSRKELLDRIKDTKSLEGVTGKISYRDGQLDRDLKILTLRGSQILEETK